MAAVPAATNWTVLRPKLTVSPRRRTWFASSGMPAKVEPFVVPRSLTRTESLSGNTSRWRREIAGSVSMRPEQSRPISIGWVIGDQQRLAPRLLDRHHRCLSYVYCIEVHGATMAPRSCKKAASL